MSDTSIKYSAFFSGPRWIDLEGLLFSVMDEHNTYVHIDRIEKKLLYKKVYFVSFPKSREILDAIIKDLERYGM